MKFEFWGQNGEISKIRDRRFENRSILRRLAFLMASYFKTKHSSSLETFAVFYPKWRNITSLKRSFSPFFFDWFTWYFRGKRQIDAGEGTYWKFRVDICRCFWAIGKILQGGAECPPPPSGARVKLEKGTRQGGIWLRQLYVPCSWPDNNVWLLKLMAHQRQQRGQEYSHLSRLYRPIRRTSVKRSGEALRKSPRNKS